MAVFQRVTKEPPTQKPACPGCGAFEPECLVPDGDGVVALCWTCAHDLVEHGRPVGHGPGSACGCSREQIFPADVIAARRDPDVAVLDSYRETPEHVGRHSLRWQALKLRG